MSFFRIALSFDTKNNDDTCVKSMGDTVVPVWYDHIQTLIDASVSSYIEFPHLTITVDI